MNWKLIVKLSIFGVAMAFGLVFGRIERIEGLLWCLIFLLYAWLIAKYCNRFYFLHGFLTSVLNGIWITIILLAFSPTFLENHPRVAENVRSFGSLTQFRLIILVAMTIVATGFGLFLGLFTQGVAYILNKRRSRQSRDGDSAGGGS